MITRRLATWAATFLALTPLTAAQVDFSVPPTCVSGLQVITTCGTFQSGYGTLQSLTQNIVASVNDSASIYNAYPANESPYYASVATGISNLQAYIAYFVNGCPDVKLVILGYSQGGQVSLSTLCGWPDGAYGFAGVTAQPSNYTDRIVAIAAYGDPTHQYPATFDRGTSTHDGEFARPVGECAPLASKMASWCDNGDTFCDNCPPPVNNIVPNPRGCNASVHTSYWDYYNPDVVDFVQSRYSAYIAAVTSSSAVQTTSTTTSTSTSTILTSAVVTSGGAKMTVASTSTGTSTTTSTITSTTTSAVTTMSSAAATRLAVPWPLQLPLRRV